MNGGGDYLAFLACAVVYFTELKPRPFISKGQNKTVAGVNTEILARWVNRGGWQLEEWMTFTILSRQWCRENKSQEFKGESCSWKMHNATVEELVVPEDSRRTGTRQSSAFARGSRPAWICSFYQVPSVICGWWHGAWCKRIRSGLIPVNEADAYSHLARAQRGECAADEPLAAVRD